MCGCDFLKVRGYPVKFVPTPIPIITRMYRGKDDMSGWRIRSNKSAFQTFHEILTVSFEEEDIDKA